MAINWPNKVMYSGLLSAIPNSAFSSLFTQTIASAPLSSAITGNTITFAITDGLSQEKAKDDAVRVYSNAAFPLATVTIVSETRDDDPFNVNPMSGKRKFYTIWVGERRVGGEYPSIPIAASFASKMHQRLVDGLATDRRKDSPNFGAF